MITAILFGAGFVVPVAVLRIEGWWLNSGRGVALALAILFALGAAAAVGRRERWPRRAGAVAFGSTVGSAAMLFRIGPGTIWPIVLVTAAALSAAAAFAGGAIASRARRV